MTHFQEVDVSHFISTFRFGDFGSRDSGGIQESRFRRNPNVEISAESKCRDFGGIQMSRIWQKPIHLNMAAVQSVPQGRFVWRNWAQGPCVPQGRFVFWRNWAQGPCVPRCILSQERSSDSKDPLIHRAGQRNREGDRLSAPCRSLYPMGIVPIAALRGQFPSRSP